MAAKAVVLLSGGLDSATALAVARSEGYSCYCLSFDYGQRNEVELAAAARVAVALQADLHRIMRIDLRFFGGSALTADLPVPKNRDETDIPITYVPARNTIFLSLGLAWAEVLAATDLFVGVNSVDYSGYPDCRPEFIAAFQKVAEMGTRAGANNQQIKIRAPLQQLGKAGIIQLGHRLGVDYSLTHSCYDPDQSGRACGSCDACRLRKSGFIEAGVIDPTVYDPQAATRKIKNTRFI